MHPHICPACRYLLKLFRDLLFHQVDEEGAPLLDWGLAVEALNKVDAGVPEKVRQPRPGGLQNTPLPCAAAVMFVRALPYASSSHGLAHSPTHIYTHPVQVLLMSRDEMSMLVVSYADVRRCIATCYDELRQRASGGVPGSGGVSGAGMQRSRSRPSMQQQY